MTKAERTALIYALCTASSGAVSYYRGRRGWDLFSDTLIFGVVSGSLGNSAAFVYDYVVEEDDAEHYALPNSSEQIDYTDMGKLPNEAVDLLRSLPYTDMYKSRKVNGVTIGEIPQNPSIVIQDES